MTTQEKVDLINNELLPLLIKIQKELTPACPIEDDSEVKASEVFKYFPNALIAYSIKHLRDEISDGIDFMI